MDMSLVTAALGMQASNTQMQVATAVEASAARAERQTVLTLLGGAQSSPSLANVGSGVGGHLNISA